jgi:glyoxylase-like metal-dependent hydrolase (beta-lactamase superfamily II)
VGAGDPDRLSHILEEVSDLAPKLLVPGHGPVGTAESLKRMRQYISTLDGLARKMVEDGEAVTVFPSSLLTFDDQPGLSLTKGRTP